ncbi:MAG: sigma 54-interacting transcriptional regulator [Desulfobacteraceae bacterium]|jgi:two-component system response regulator HydG|nr:sigma 54-interacting transcriptional regulator [Desulfobacteraceae bacterium]
MKLNSLRSKLVISVSALVIGSGLVISLLETNRFSKSLHEFAISQGKYLSQGLALEATNLILINDLIALQTLLNNHLLGHPLLSYIFVVKEDQILAHTFSEGFPRDLLNINTTKNNETGNFKRISTNEGENYIDIAWPIFSGKAGVLRLGLTEKHYHSQVLKLWIEMTSLTLGILFLALSISFLFIKRITRPLSALAEAAENMDERNLELRLEPAGRDEVGRLTTAINRMLDRIREYTQRFEKNAQEVDRAHQQTKNSFEIIKKIWEQDSLEDVCRYLIWKFQKIVACEELVLYIFGSNKETLFAFFDSEIKTFRRQEFEAILPLLAQLDDITFIKKSAFDTGLVPNPFQSTGHVATFPIHHENQILGALLIPCPGNCKCDQQELGIVNLVLNHSARAIKHAVAQEEEMLNLRSRIETTTEYCGIVGKDPKMQTIYKLIEDIAPSDTSVLIQGESGTGKELIARALHLKSLRREEPFVVINCSAYPSTLLESELFGHEKGAFTGAVRQKAGRFEQAHQGTVFLDEIGEIPPSAQIKLLRVLQTQKFERVGGEHTLTVDVRILAATNKDLLQEVKNGHFREDLYYRLNVIPIQLPPLSKRRNDIPLQARFFMERYATEQGKNIKEFSSEAMRLLLDYRWPGNVRELENSIEHAVVLAKGNQIEVSDLPPTLHYAPSAAATSTTNTMMENEAKLLKEALDECGWNKKQAAQQLGISRNTLYRKLRKYQIKPPTIH